MSPLCASPRRAEQAEALISRALVLSRASEGRQPPKQTARTGRAWSAVPWELPTTPGCINGALSGYTQSPNLSLWRSRSKGLLGLGQLGADLAAGDTLGAGRPCPRLHQTPRRCGQRAQTRQPNLRSRPETAKGQCQTGGSSSGGKDTSIPLKVSSNQARTGTSISVTSLNHSRLSSGSSAGFCRWPAPFHLPRGKGPAPQLPLNAPCPSQRARSARSARGILLPHQPCSSPCSFPTLAQKRTFPVKRAVPSALGWHSCP